MWPRGTLLALVFLIGASGALGETAAPYPPAATPPDPLRLAAATLSLNQLGFGAGEGWSGRLELGYFNLWNGTWHTGTIHKEFGLLGTPLQAWELRTLEERHSGDAIYRYDLEGWVGTVSVAYRHASGMVLSWEVPWLNVGAPHWDSVAWRFHSAVGLDQARRDWFPRGQTVVYAYYGGATIEGWGELAGLRLADVTFAASGPLGEILGGTHRWSVALQAPTGQRSTLAGSGGWDGGVRWGAQWLAPRHRLVVAAGYTWLDEAGTFLGARRSDTYHAQVGGAYRAGRATWVELFTRADSSPLKGFSPSAAAASAVMLSLGVARQLGGAGWVRLELGENLPQLGAAPDFTLVVALTWALGK